MRASAGPFGRLDGTSSTLFLVAGGLLLVFAANTAARVFAGTGVPPVHSIVGPAGFFVGLVGVFGLYPGLADRGSTLAHLAVIVAAVPLVGWFVVTGFGLGSAAGVLPDMSVVFPGGVVIVIFVTTMVTYLLFGAAALRAEGHGLPVGLLLVAPAVPFLVLMVAVATMPPVEWAEFVVDAGHALAHLAVGLGLRSAGIPGDRPQPAADSVP